MSIGNKHSSDFVSDDKYNSDSLNQGFITGETLDLLPGVHYRDYVMALLNAIPFPLIVLNNEGHFRWFNQAFRNKFGFVHSPADLQEDNLRNFLADVMTSLKSHSDRDSKIHYQGRVYWARMVPITWASDDIGSFILFRDMSQVEKLFLELAHAKGLNQQLDRIINSSFDGIYITDGHGNTLRLNHAFERITGVPASECLGRNMADLVEEGQFSRSGTLLALKRGESVTVPLQAKTGKNALVTSTPIFDDDGEIALVVTNVRDMTELVELQQKLEKVEGLRQRELDAIFDSSYDGLYITDGEGNTLRLNKGFERITGVTANECIGRNMAELVKEGFFSRSGTLMALKQRQAVTVPLQAKTGKNALVTSTPIFDDEGNIVLVVTNVRDLTELNDLQQKVDHLENLREAYHTQLLQMRQESAGKYVFNSPKMRELRQMLIHVASVDSTVLIQGESGVGKEVVADLLHTFGRRRDMPFIKINCAAIPENLLESELFGYEAGAFSGADRRGKIGMFELANGGTLFLDEISELPLDLQVKLLRVLQDKIVMRVGGTKQIQVDVRILTGTNINLMDLVQSKKFRADLFYRCNVVPIYVPPLRERREDIPVLCAHFLDMFNRQYGLNKTLSPEALQFFMDYDWPGNVRELRNLMERLVVTTRHDLISINDWDRGPIFPHHDQSEIVPLQQALDNTERRILEAAFQRYSTTYEIAEALGISQASVVRKAGKYDIIRKTRLKNKAHHQEHPH